MKPLYAFDSLRINSEHDFLAVSGWVVQPDDEILSVSAQINDSQPARCQYTTARPDVIARHDLPRSLLRCGFQGQVPLNGRRGIVTVTLMAELCGGRQLQVCTRQVNLRDAGEISFHALDKARLLQLPEETPVFVVGMTRSGTSALTSALLDGARIPGYREGHLFDMLEEVLTSIVAVW